MTVWTNRKPGELPAIEEEDGTVCIYIGVPHWVELPPELGSGRARVINQTIEECVCGNGHRAKHLHLEGDVHVAECMDIGFAWYRLNTKEEA